MDCDCQTDRSGPIRRSVGRWDPRGRALRPLAVVAKRSRGEGRRRSARGTEGILHFAHVESRKGVGPEHLEYRLDDGCDQVGSELLPRELAPYLRALGRRDAQNHGVFVSASQMLAWAGRARGSTRGTTSRASASLKRRGSSDRNEPSRPSVTSSTGAREDAGKPSGCLAAPCGPLWSRSHSGQVARRRPASSPDPSSEHSRWSRRLCPSLAETRNRAVASKTTRRVKCGPPGQGAWGRALPPRRWPSYQIAAGINGMDRRIAGWEIRPRRSGPRA